MTNIKSLFLYVFFYSKSAEIEGFIPKSPMKDENPQFDTEFSELLKKIAKRLRELRVDAGYTSYESFAWENGINRMQIWKMEKGETNITLKSLYKILKVHGISYEEFFSSIDYKI